MAHPDPDGDDPALIDPRGARLDELLTHGKKAFQYEYDFGDGWEHTVTLKAIAEAETGLAYPRLIDALRACPPEDVGGPLGYEEYLEAIADPKHPRHEELTQWRGPGFDRDFVDEKRSARNWPNLCDG